MTTPPPPFRWQNTWDEPLGPASSPVDVVALVGEYPVREIGRIYQEAFGSRQGMWRWSFYGAFSPIEIGQSQGISESREAAEAALAAHWARWLDWRRANPSRPLKVWKEACLYWPDGKPEEAPE